MTFTRKCRDDNFFLLQPVTVATTVFLKTKVNDFTQFKKVYFIILKKRYF